MRKRNGIGIHRLHVTFSGGWARVCMCCSGCGGGERDVTGRVPAR